MIRLESGVSRMTWTHQNGARELVEIREEKTVSPTLFAYCTSRGKPFCVFYTCVCFPSIIQRLFRCVINGFLPVPPPPMRIRNSSSDRRGRLARR